MNRPDSKSKISEAERFFEETIIKMGSASKEIDKLHEQLKEVDEFYGPPKVGGNELAALLDIHGGRESEGAPPADETATVEELRAEIERLKAEIKAFQAPAPGPVPAKPPGAGIRLMFGGRYEVEGGEARDLALSLTAAGSPGDQVIRVSLGGQNFEIPLSQLQRPVREWTPTPTYTPVLAATPTPTFPKLFEMVKGDYENRVDMEIEEQEERMEEKIQNEEELEEKP